MSSTRFTGTNKSYTLLNDFKPSVLTVSILSGRMP